MRSYYVRMIIFVRIKCFRFCKRLQHVVNFTFRTDPPHGRMHSWESTTFLRSSQVSGGYYALQCGGTHNIRVWRNADLVVCFWRRKKTCERFNRFTKKYTFTQLIQWYMCVWKCHSVFLYSARFRTRPLWDFEEFYADHNTHYDLTMNRSYVSIW